LVDVMPPEFCRDVVLATFDDDALAWLASLVTAYGTSRFGFDWGKQLIEYLEAKSASPAQVASLLKAWNDTQILFDYVDSKDVEIQSHYWSLRDIFIRSEITSLVDHGVSKLSVHGRNAELVQFLGGRLNETNSSVLIEVLDRALQEILDDPQKIRHVDSYWLNEIFDALRKRADADRTVLMGLEYRWLPAFHAYAERQELLLHDHMGSNPEFFMEVLCDLYKADWEVNEKSDEGDSIQEITTEGEDDEKLIDPQKHAKAEIAFKILESWQKLPWLSEDGSVDYSVMLSWAQAVLVLAKKHGRYEVAAGEIGKLLAYAPDDVIDGIWPVRQVRDLIEELSNPELESRIITELFNKRGVHWAPMDGGGSQERELAMTSNKAADALQVEWPRTAEMLRKNAKQWLHHAEWEDRRAAERRITL